MASLGAPFGRGSRHSLLGSAQRLQGAATSTARRQVMGVKKKTPGMGPPLDSVQLPYKWLSSMVYGRYNELVNDGYNGL